MGIINDAKAWLRDHGIPQWQNGYPNEETLAGDLALQSGFAADDGTVIGYCFIRQMEDPCYGVIEGGRWKNDRPYLVLHRTAISSACKGQGVAGQFVRYAETMAAERGIKDLRADTHRKNTSMRRMLEKNGFEACGIVYMQDGTERIAYHKVLDEKL